MNWTMERPTKKGWYWFCAVPRMTGQPEVVLFEPLTEYSLFVWRVMTDSYTLIEEMRGVWAGPLEQPPMLDGAPILIDPHHPPGRPLTIIDLSHVSP